MMEHTGNQIDHSENQINHSRNQIDRIGNWEADIWKLITNRGASILTEEDPRASILSFTKWISILLLSPRIRVLYGVAVFGAACTLLNLLFSRSTGRSTRIAALGMLILMTGKILIHSDTCQQISNALGSIQGSAENTRLISMSEIYGTKILFIELAVVMLSSHILLRNEIMMIGKLRLRIGAFLSVLMIGCTLCAAFRFYSMDGPTLANEEDLSHNIGYVLCGVIAHAFAIPLCSLIDTISTFFSRIQPIRPVAVRVNGSKY